MAAGCGLRNDRGSGGSGERSVDVEVLAEVDAAAGHRAEAEEFGPLTRRPVIMPVWLGSVTVFSTDGAR